MASVEKERVLGKKRENLGSSSGRRIFESKKEKKKRRLILSYSESDDDTFVTSPRGKASAADNVGEANVEAKSDLGSEAVNPRERAEGKEKAFVDSEVHQNGVELLHKEKSITEESANNGEIKMDLLSSEVTEERKRSSFCESANAEEIKAESDKTLSLQVVGKKVDDVDDDDKNIDNPLPIEGKDSIDRLASKEGGKVESETVPHARKQAEDEIIQKADDVSRASHNRKSSVIQKNGLNRLRNGEERNIDAKAVLKSKLVKGREEADIKKEPFSFTRVDQNGRGSMSEGKNGMNRSSSKEKVEAKQVLKTKVVKEREASGNNMKSLAFSGNDQKGSNSCSRKKINSDSNEDGRNMESKRIPKKSNFFEAREKAVFIKEMEKTVSVKKKTPEPGSERKRTGDKVEDEMILKKARSEPVKQRQEQNKETGEKNMKKKLPRSEDKGCEMEANPGSNSAVSGITQREESNEKRMQEVLKKKNEPKTEHVKWIERSTARSLRKLKDNSSSGSARRKDRDISQQKGIKMDGKSSVMRVLPSNKKVGGIESGDILGEAKIRKNVAEHPLLSVEQKVEKAISTCKSTKDKLNTERVSTAMSERLTKPKAEAETSSLKVKSKKVYSSNVMTGPTASVKPQSKSDASTMFELDAKDKTSERRSTVKQRVRDQIKEILLNAGWKIDLRPRRGRAYEDAVYIPPAGGSGFWSITKAYAVYVKSNTLTGNSSKTPTGGKQVPEGTSSTFATVPADLLNLLTRNVVNKRRNKKEIERTKKLGLTKKGKRGLKIKGSKKDRKGDDEEGKVRKKRNSDMDRIGSAARKLHLRVRNKKQKGRALLVRRVNEDADTDDDDDYVPYVWKRTMLSWMIDLGVVSVDEKVKYMNKKHTRALLEGSITREGIRCGCCSKIISIAKFEIHAGSKLQQPHENIIVEGTGCSLLQCQLNAWEKQEESERQGFYRVDIEGDDPNDDTCGLCGDGGDLICCDGCPSTFHLNCLGIQMLPPGDWHCTNCSCRYCGLVSDAVPEESTSSTSALQTCSQCEKKYHGECSQKVDAVPVSSNDSDLSFCGNSCKKVFKRLQKLLGTKNDLGTGLSWSLVRRFDKDSSGHPCSLPQKVECNSKIAIAFAVMDECFRPIIDHRSGINLIHNVVYNCGSNIKRLSYTGFYTFVLERGDEIIAVASVRIHGTRLAEMPFIGTRNMYRRQGMCRQLLSGIESALCSLNVEKLVIPAISELTETWTNVFGFKPLNLSQKSEVSSMNMLVFPGTGLLHKPTLKKVAIEEHMTSSGAELGEAVIRCDNVCKEANACFVLSSGQPKASASDKVAHPKNEAESAEPISVIENSDALPRPEFQNLQHKLPETSTDVDLAVQSAVGQVKLIGNDTHNANSCDEPNIKISCGDDVPGDQEPDNLPSTVASANLTVDVSDTIEAPLDFEEGQTHGAPPEADTNAHDAKAETMCVKPETMAVDNDTEACP